MKNTNNEKVKMIIPKRKELVDFIGTVLVFVLFVAIISHLVCSSVKMSPYKDFTQIFEYYDYTDASNYKMITPKGLKIDFSDAKHFLQIEDFYVDDFGNIYRINYSQSLFFKTKMIQTLVEPTDKNGTIIRVPNGYGPICSCTTPCSHKDLSVANPCGYTIKGRTVVDYCYDYVSENDAIMIRPDKFEKFCVDDFGKAYKVKYTLHGRDITELKSKREGGIIISICAHEGVIKGVKGEKIFPLNVLENADKN